MITDLAIYLLATFAACRINRLVVVDTLTKPGRDFLAKKDGKLGRLLSYVANCVWCTGVYTATACAAYAHWISGWGWEFLPLTALSIAWIAPVLAGWIED